jgi:hypothetical protein
MVSDSARVYTLLLARARTDGEVADAIERIRREARTIRSTMSGASYGWVFENAMTASVDIAASGGRLYLDANVLAEGVDSFEIKYFNGSNTELPVPLSPSDSESVCRVQVFMRVTNSHAASEAIVNLHLQGGYLK